MNKYKEQTVYIPTEEMTDFYCSNDIGDAFSLIKQEKILLSKEQLIEVVGKAFEAGGDYSTDALSGISSLLKSEKPLTKEQFINNILL